jgi:hypothetical protein
MKNKYLITYTTTDNQTLQAVVLSSLVTFEDLADSFAKFGAITDVACIDKNSLTIPVIVL